MTYTPQMKAPAGWCQSVLIAGDTLAVLAKAAKVSPVEVAAANGVPAPKDAGKPGCEWGRDVAAWVLATGGKRLPVVAGQLNTCEPGLGHVSFVPGQRVWLPAGVRACASPKPNVPPSAPSTPPAKVAAGGVMAGGLALFALAALALRRKKPKPGGQP